MVGVLGKGVVGVTTRVTSGCTPGAQVGAPAHHRANTCLGTQARGASVNTGTAQYNERHHQ